MKSKKWLIIHSFTIFKVNLAAKWRNGIYCESQIIYYCILSNSVCDKSLHDKRLLSTRWETSDYFSVPARLINQSRHVSLRWKRFAHVSWWLTRFQLLLFQSFFLLRIHFLCKAKRKFIFLGKISFPLITNLYFRNYFAFFIFEDLQKQKQIQFLWF